MIGFLGFLRFWKVYALIGVIVGIGITHYMAYNKGIEAERSRNVHNIIEKRKDLNAIRDNRPDTVQLLDRLRRGDF